MMLTSAPLSSSAALSCVGDRTRLHRSAVERVEVQYGGSSGRVPISREAASAAAEPIANSCTESATAAERA